MITPEQAAVFYEDDEDLAAVFAWFDESPARVEGEPVTAPAGGVTVGR